MSAHASPAQIRANLSHPIVDGDGHWLEYAPVFSEKMRKAGGDKAADGFLAALQIDHRRAQADRRRSAPAAASRSPISGTARPRTRSTAPPR